MVTLPVEAIASMESLEAWAESKLAAVSARTGILQSKTAPPGLRASVRLPSMCSA
jgi:hypothetical protein